jgi:hypothetical protein
MPLSSRAQRSEARARVTRGTSHGWRLLLELGDEICTKTTRLVSPGDVLNGKFWEMR